MCAYMYVQKPEESAKCPALSLPALFLGNSLSLILELALRPVRQSSCLCPMCHGGSRSTWPCLAFYMGDGVWTQAFAFCTAQLSYPLSHLLSLGSSSYLVFLGSLPHLHLWLCLTLFCDRVSLCSCLSFSSAGITRVSHCARSAWLLCFFFFLVLFSFLVLCQPRLVLLEPDACLCLSFQW